MHFERLRPKHDPSVMRDIYKTPHNHAIYGLGHHLRVEATKLLASNFHKGSSVGDLSCGNAAIANSLQASRRELGDFAPGYPYEGMLEDTLPTMQGVDTYICSETLEHLDNPSEALTLMRQKASMLVLSTPIEAWGDANAEHYWSWDREYIEYLLGSTGWNAKAFLGLDSRCWGEPYYYGIWIAT